MRIKSGIELRSELICASASDLKTNYPPCNTINRWKCEELSLSLIAPTQTSVAEEGQLFFDWQ